MGLKILKWKSACVSCFFKIIWNPFSLKIISHQEFGHQAVLSADIIREKGCRSCDKLVEVIALFFAHFFSSFLHSLVAPVMLSIY